VDSDQQWVLRYGDLVPVLMVNGRMCGFWRLVESEVEQEVRAAVGATEGADPPPSSNSL
jgi:hypothetical protein